MEDKQKLQTLARHRETLEFISSSFTKYSIPSLFVAQKEIRRSI